MRLKAETRTCSSPGVLLLRSTVMTAEVCWIGEETLLQRCGDKADLSVLGRSDELQIIRTKCLAEREGAAAG